LDYIGQITLTDNTTVYAKGIDEAGNESVVVSLVVDNIDKVAPVITVSEYITTPTNKDITVTATTNEGTLNTASHVFTENGNFDFVATDDSGNVTTKTVTIDNIDKEAPVITIGDYITILTNQDVVVTATTNEGILNEESHTFIENGNFEFIATDESGNITSKTVTITNIKKATPIITINDYVTTPTNQDVVVSATVNTGTLNEASHTFTKNGEFTFIVIDDAGNTSSKTVTITNIDKEAPVITAVVQDTDTLTDSKIVTVTVSDTNSFTVELPDKSIKTNETGFTYEILKNGRYVFIATDILGNVSTASVSTDKINIKITETTTVVYNEIVENREATIHVIAESALGITSIAIDGAITEGKEASYLVKANKVYTVIITNSINETLTKEVAITGINETPTPPEVTVDLVQNLKDTTINITALPVYDTTIKNIRLFKSGTLLTKNAYKTSLSYTTPDSGTFEAIVENSKSEQTITTFVIEDGVVTFTSTVTILSDRASIFIDTVSSGNANVAEINITGFETLETVYGVTNTTFEVTENGEYLITVKDTNGKSETKTVVVEGINPDFYITFSVDDTEAEDGLVFITANVIGEFDSLSYGEQTVAANTLTIPVTIDGTYTFKATKGMTVVTTDVTITIFANLPPIKTTISMTALPTGKVLTNIKALSLDGSLISNIKIYKNGILVTRNSYKSSIAFNADVNEEYEVIVTNNKRVVTSKTFTVFYIDTSIDESRSSEGIISITANVTGTIDSLSMGDKVVTENTLTVEITESGTYTFKAVRGKNIVKATLIVDMSKYITKNPSVEIMADGTLNEVNVTINAIPVDGTSIARITVLKDGVKIIENNYRNTLVFTTAVFGTYEVTVENNLGEKTIKTFLVEYIPIVITANYNILGPNASIVVNATTIEGSTISTIVISGQGITEKIENLGDATFTVNKNGEYLVTVTNSDGYIKTRTIRVTGINTNPYVVLTSDASSVTAGYISINAKAFGDYDTLTFEGNIATSSAITAKVTTDGTYVFTLTKGTETFNYEIAITAFADALKLPGIEVLVTDNTDGSYLINVIATPVSGTTIKAIKLYKDGVYIAKNSYRNTFSTTVKDAGTYKIEVIDSLNITATKEFTIE